MSKFDTDNLSAPHTQRELGTKPAPAVDVSTEAVMRLLDGVTPGPWEEDRSDAALGYADIYENSGRKSFHICSVTGIPNREHIRNANFIAASRDLVPAVLADRDRLADEVARLRRNDRSLHNMIEKMLTEGANQMARAEAAEAEVARLREALRQIDIGQSAEPDHWKFRVRAREIARAARRKGGAA